MTTKQDKESRVEVEKLFKDFETPKEEKVIEEVNKPKKFLNSHKVNIGKLLQHSIELADTEVILTRPIKEFGKGGGHITVSGSHVGKEAKIFIKKNDKT